MQHTIEEMLVLDWECTEKLKSIVLRLLCFLEEVKEDYQNASEGVIVNVSVLITNDDRIIWSVDNNSNILLT